MHRFDQYFFESQQRQFVARGPVWIAILTLFFGVITFWAKQSWLLPFFLPAAYFALALVFVRTDSDVARPFQPTLSDFDNRAGSFLGSWLFDYEWSGAGR